jgi:predicted permease
MQWLKHLFTRRRIYSDLSEEIQQHLAEKIAALMAAGMSPKEAASAAKREFGNVTSIEESGREAWTWPRAESVLSDAKFALRKLKQSPGFATTAILTLALGIGANVVVFSVLNGLILRPLDVPEPSNLFQIMHGKDWGGSQSYRDYLDYRDRDASFSGMLAYQYLRAGVRVGKTVAQSWGFDVSGNYFDVLGVQPAFGHFFHAADEHGPASAPYIVLSYDFWRLHFDSNPHVLGETIELNQHPLTVIGVARRDFHGTEPLFVADYWIPLVNATQVTGFDDLPYRDHYAFTVLGRLKPGVTPQQATRSLNIVAAQMAKEDPKDDGLTALVRLAGPAGDEQDPTKKALLGILLLAILVLLAACANLASIFAARATDRGGELAIRLAIGASRWMILRQLLTEAVIVSIVGAAMGAFFARLLLGALSRLQIFGDFPTHFMILPDGRVYLAALALSIASGIFFGLLPARQIWKTDVVQAIKTGCLETESFRRLAVRDVLLAVQIVVCTLLVTASLVGVRGLMLALHVPLAIQPEQVTLAQADLRMAGYSGEQALPVQKRLLEAARSIPGVSAAAVSDGVPFLGGGGDWFVYRWGTTEFLPSHMAFDALSFLISPGYVNAAGTRLLAGRDFNWHDAGGSPRVAIVNQTFARKLYGDKSAVGQRFALWETAKYEVVGVVEDGKYGSVSEDPHAAMFLPLAQGVGEVMSPSATILVRSKLPQDQIAVALRQKLIAIEPGAPFTIRSWADAIDLSMLVPRAVAAVLGVMGLLAAMLAVTGVFGMASYSVSKRRKEQGIRMALGAQPVDILRSTLHRPLLLLIGGSCLGLVGGMLTSRLLAHLVSFATPRDPLVLAGVLFVMTFLGLLATWVPARRALGVDPSRLLRE